MSNFMTPEDPSRATTPNTGILPEQLNSTLIDDGVFTHGADLNKLGSSMPTALARLFLFSSALKEINALEALPNHKGIAHRGRIDSDSGHIVPTAYHKLVDDLLDMLEFIYKYGDDFNFKAECWGIDAEYAHLKQSNETGHHRLADALKAAFSYPALQGIKQVYVFKWGDMVIGGTSPISLVYTSPNLIDELQPGTLVGYGGRNLFTGKTGITPLCEREPAFREYLYRLSFAMGNNFADLKRFLQDSGSEYDKDLYDKVKVNPSDFGTAKKLASKPDNIDVIVNGVQLMVTDNTVHVTPQTSDYLMKTTSDNFRHNHSDRKTPLALTKAGIPGARFVASLEWNQKMWTDCQAEDVFDRHLMGFGEQVKYPQIVPSDFLEDRIIEVSYNLNDTAFFTGSKKPCRYLLPLKKLFFDFFKVSDLINEKGESTGMLTMDCDDDHEIVTVTLRIPLLSDKTIEFKKVYKTGGNNPDKFDAVDQSNTFDFAMFPCYRLYIEDSNTKSDNLTETSSYNVYNLMLGTTIRNASFRFYEPGFFHPKDSNTQEVTDEVNANKHLRTERGVNGASLSTEHIHVDGSFSYMELNIPDDKTDADVHAVIIPIFRRINADRTKATFKMSFAIDFGTTNTHVVQIKVPNGKPSSPDKIESFEYGTPKSPDDVQMVTFNSASGMGEFVSFDTILKREFVPVKLGQEIKFPMRTATYQQSGLLTGLEMFFNTNIGFNYKNDLILRLSNDYRTNIKWNSFDGMSEDRMRTFFEQILWMMKNESVLNGGSDSFNVAVTYPISMSDSDRTTFENAWTEAVNKVRCNANIIYCTESIAPYFEFNRILKFAQPYTNIDIGGGTTDFVYYDKNTKESIVFSAFFAANDLWGDGIEKSAQGLKENGFVQFYKKSRYWTNDKVVMDVYEDANSSSDIISYLFSNDEKTRFSKALRESRTEMLQLPVLHFTSLIYYLAYCVYMAEVSVPTEISFTGMGSKYIQLISPNEGVIAKIIESVFHYFGKKFSHEELEKANVTVHFADNPKEVTAKGALMSIQDDQGIHPVEQVYHVYEDEDTTHALRYNQVTEQTIASVGKMFNGFIDMLEDSDVVAVLNDLSCDVSLIPASLRGYANNSLRQMHTKKSGSNPPNTRVREPMFFWPLKQSIYLIGKDIAAKISNAN